MYFHSPGYGDDKRWEYPLATTRVYSYTDNMYPMLPELQRDVVSARQLKDFNENGIPLPAGARDTGFGLLPPGTFGAPPSPASEDREPAPPKKKRRLRGLGSLYYKPPWTPAWRHT